MPVGDFKRKCDVHAVLVAITSSAMKGDFIQERRQLSTAVRLAAAALIYLLDRLQHECGGISRTYRGESLGGGFGGELQAVFGWFVRFSRFGKLLQLSKNRRWRNFLRNIEQTATATRMTEAHPAGIDRKRDRQKERNADRQEPNKHARMEPKNRRHAAGRNDCRRAVRPRRLLP